MLLFLLSFSVFALCSESLSSTIQSRNVAKLDVILSSGFLAFSRQAGFLSAVEDFQIPIGRVVGTSSGSLAGAIYAAGFNADRVAFELKQRRPIQYISGNVLNLSQGVCDLSRMTAYLRTILPKDFSELPIPLAVGVIDCATKKYELVTGGDLPLAVTASCAIPMVFQPIRVGNRMLAGGGVTDRTGISHWEEWVHDTMPCSSPSPRMPQPRAIVHVVGTSVRRRKPTVDVDGDSMRSTNAASLAVSSRSALFEVHTPRARANFFSLRDYDTQRLVAYACAAKRFLSPNFATFLESSASPADGEGGEIV